MIVILHDIRSAHNVGSIFRTAEGAGVEKIYLSGYTPQPIDRFGREQSEIKKTSLGAAKLVPWEYTDELPKLINRLRAGGVVMVSVEQDPASVPHHTQEFGENVAYIFGNEIDGVPKEIQDLSDTVVEVSMHGKKESLNVAVCAGIILFGARSALRLWQK